MVNWCKVDPFLDTDTQPLDFLVTYLGRQHCCGNEYWTGD